MDPARLLGTRWGVSPDRVATLPGGMNSQTWLVHAGPDSFVLKAVGADIRAFAAGLETARIVEAGGIPAGSPLRSRAGAWSEVVDGRRFALLRYVDGEPLTADDQVAIGTTLGGVHRLTATEPSELAGWVDWLDMFGPHLDAEPWIRPAVTAAVDAVRTLPGPGCWARLHGDPSPDDFRRRPDGTVGLIDWGAAMTGPVLYDVASAVMFLGGPAVAAPMVDAYRAHGPATDDEITAGLDTFVRLRWAVQAAYYSWRSSVDDRTGLDGADGNRAGLADARRGLGA